MRKNDRFREQKILERELVSVLVPSLEESLALFLEFCGL